MVCYTSSGNLILIAIVTRLQQEEPRSLIFQTGCVDDANTVLILFVLLIIHFHVLTSRVFKFYVLKINQVLVSILSNNSSNLIECYVKDINGNNNDKFYDCSRNSHNKYERFSNLGKLNFCDN